MAEEDTALERRKGWMWLAVILAVMTFLYVAVPRYLKDVVTKDLQGIPTRVSPGVILNLQNMPNNPGGGDDWNSVELAFDGRKSFYTLPRTSKWSPLPKEPVTVRYRVGRSGVVQIDSVEPADAHPTYGPVR